VLAVLAKDSPLAKIVGTNVEGNTGDTLASLQEDFYRTDHEHSAAYQLAVVDYVEEWETLVAKRIEPEIRLSNKLHKVLQHYESKVEKLREHVHDQEAHDKAPHIKESNKLERNEKKLSDAWTEHDKTATRTSNLIESATKSRWKDLYPLLQAMALCEQGRELDQHDLWERASLIQGKLDSIVTQYDNPLAEGAKDAPPPASGKVEHADPTEPHSDESGDEY
jgi:exonuclease VII small subunit